MQLQKHSVLLCITELCNSMHLSLEVTNSKTTTPIFMGFSQNNSLCLCFCPAVITEISEVNRTPLLASYFRAMTFYPQLSKDYGKLCSLNAAKN